MLFNSIDFAIFLPIVFLLYWLVLNKSIKAQNILILIASYFFYAYWDWRFLFLIIFSTLVDYFVAILIDKSIHPQKRKLFLSISVLINIGLLGFFKYYNFFVDSFNDAFSVLGFSFGVSSLKIVLPVGISFYTFQTLSYTIDVYKRKLKPTKDIVSFASFVSFFPQLVAGPIERATNLLPQFFKRRNFNYQLSVDGLRQILWGLVKKIVIADNCAEFANQAFQNTEAMNGSALVMGAIFFAFQIYGDFSGYSDIAIGTSRLFGFNLKKNFATPYFSRNVAEFWRRWHISLSTWFRDYLYIPLGGSKGSKSKVLRNVLLIFIISGFWHGANWTFVFWGFLNALFFIPLLISGGNRKYIDVVASDSVLPSFKELLLMLFTFLLITFTWVFFRAESLAHVLDYFLKIASPSLFSIPNFIGKRKVLELIVLLLLFLIIEWKGRKTDYGLAKIAVNKPAYVRYTLYYVLIISLFLFNGEKQQFIYFQF